MTGPGDRIGADAWLSQVMGRPVFRVDVGGAEASPAGWRGLAASVSSHAADRPGAFYFAKVDTCAVGAVRALGAVGFYVVDVNVQLERVPSGSVPDAGATVRVAPCGPGQADAVLDIAGSCFRYSRFHLDPAVSSELAHRVKREWIASYVEHRRGETLLVAAIGDEPVGFLAVLATQDRGAEVRVIDLVGVGDAWQGRGVGKALVAAFVRRYPAVDRLRVGTQAANVPSLRLYDACGFAIARTEYVMHFHPPSEGAGHAHR